jgi:predicted adenine nucleotide alpha hydrolase (AANH) superfamily ATPase
MAMPTVLVHICCAPDALFVLDQLKDEYEAAGFFYNPNIFPTEEYDRRLQEAENIGRVRRFAVVRGARDHELWLKMTAKFKEEPEMGRRCDICYAMRLNRTARIAAGRGFDFFTTVMSVSPWKKAASLNRIGRMLGRRYGIPFIEADFKKQDGFRRSVEMSKSYNLYRQDYCGCPYSRRPRIP